VASTTSSLLDLPMEGRAQCPVRADDALRSRNDLEQVRYVVTAPRAAGGSANLHPVVESVDCSGKAFVAVEPGHWGGEVEGNWMDKRLTYKERANDRTHAHKRSSSQTNVTPPAMVSCSSCGCGNSGLENSNAVAE